LIGWLVGWLVGWLIMYLFKKYEVVYLLSCVIKKTKDFSTLHH